MPEQNQVQPAKKSPSKIYLVILVIAVLAIAGGLYFVLGSNEEASNSNSVSITNTQKTATIGAFFAYVEGAVEYKKAGGDWMRAEESDDLYEGYSVEIVGEGRAIINLDDGSAIRMNNDTKLTLKSMDPNDIVVVNENGEVYSRVATADRTYTVESENVSYEAMGTAYNTINKETENGVEVYQSSVKVKAQNQEIVTVEEGSKYFVKKDENPDEANQVKEMTQEEAKNKEFVMWNKEKDESGKKELGFLDFENKEDSESEEETTEDIKETTPDTTSNITLTGSTAENGVALSWTVINVEIDHGFKVVKGTSANPVYPGNNYHYASGSATRSYLWKLTSGETYHFRVCKYDGSGTCVLYSNDVTATAPGTPPIDVSLTMSVTAEETGVGIWWTDASTISGFKYYKVVRSKTNADLQYPDDGYISAQGENSTSYRDLSAVNGTSYYYRICAVGDETICSNVLQITAINENNAPSAVTLSGSISSGEVTLSWTKSGELDFKYYKVAWSQTNVTPTYPTDGYLSAISNASTVSYVDKGGKAGSARDVAVDLTNGKHFYSICVVDTANQVTCSNTVKVEDGIVQ